MRAFAGWHSAWSEEKNDAALIEAKVTLQQGLIASQREGRLISAKFEIEDGKLQLSVYTEKDDKFFEVIVDHMTGQIAKSEPITEGDDLADAKTQSAAMAKAKTDLKAAADKVAGGSRVVAVTHQPSGGIPALPLESAAFPRRTGKAGCVLLVGAQEAEGAGGQSKQSISERKAASGAAFLLITEFESGSAERTAGESKAPRASARG